MDDTDQMRADPLAEGFAIDASGQLHARARGITLVFPMTGDEMRSLASALNRHAIIYDLENKANQPRN